MLKRLSRSIRYRLGMHVVAPDLEAGADEGVVTYYNSRPSRCSFLQDPEHYERPRIEWILETAKGGRLLVIGCADGGVSALLATQVGSMVAVDVCEASITELLARGLSNLEAYVGLAEAYEPDLRFDWIIMSEVLEHVRKPYRLVARTLRWLAPGGRLLARFRLVGRLTLEEMAALLSLCSCVVSTDSGPFHIAGVLGRPGIGLFRASRPEHARRYPSISPVVAPDLADCRRSCSWDRCRWSPCRQMSAILPETVLEAVQARLRGGPAA
jgi:SAM-dependent methyltransferase